MLKNHIRLALRSFIRNKQVTIINLVGLSIGMASAIIIFIWTSQELSYDNFHEKKDRIVRITQDGYINGDDLKVAMTAPGLGKKMHSLYPEIESTTRLKKHWSNAIVKFEDVSYYESKIFFADSNFLDIFTFPLLKGNPNAILDDPNTLIISAKIAHKYFGNEDPIGKTIKIDDKPYLVNGVFQDIPKNSHLDCDIICSLSSIPQLYYAPRIMGGSIYTYILIKEANYISSFKEKTDDFINNYLKADMEKQGIDIEALMGMDANNYYQYQLQKIEDIHLKSQMRFELKEGGNLKIVYMFITIGIVILLIACINFINLTTSRLLIRNKEIALRKIVGAQRKSIILQILTETIFISIIALQLAIILVEILRPGFNHLINSSITINYLDTRFLIFCVLIIVFSGLLSGLYPGFLYSSFKPIKLLKYRYLMNKDKRSFRRPFLFLQYAIAFVIIVFTFVVNKQLNFIIEKDLGYDYNNTIIIQKPKYSNEKINAFFKEMENEPNVLNIGTTDNIFGESYDDNTCKEAGTENIVNLQITWSDHTYTSMFDIEMVEGRFFDDSGNDTNNVVINEQAVKAFNFDNPIGKIIHGFNSPDDLYKIIGVIKDHHYESLQNKIKPLMISYYPKCHYIAIKLNKKNIESSIQQTEDKWLAHFPEIPLHYNFLDHKLENLYRNYFISKNVLLIFSFIAILIACIGLYGFSTFTTERKTKEIGIRKVNGGTSANILRLLLFDQIKISIIAIIVSIPISIYFINRWLQNFAFGISNYWFVFFEAGTILLLIALSTIGLQTYLASIKNPVDCLRYE